MGGGFKWPPAHSVPSTRINLCWKILDLVIYHEFDLRLYYPINCLSLVIEVF